MSSMDPGAVVEDFQPTHVVPPEGLAAWEVPDVSRPTMPLDAFLPVQLLTRRGEWAEILCANGWSAWVDGRLLVSVPLPPPTTGRRPPLRAEDPRPLLTHGADALERYRHALEELAAGNTDADGFRRALRGLRAGVVLDGESVWLYDEASGRWLYGDGSRLSTYAVAEGPGVTSAPEPTRAGPDTAGPSAPPAGPVEAHQTRDSQDDPTRIVDTRDPGGA
ncbi:hypothetical protein [Streptomyces sp. NPDC047014]|uniref:hypothetical protein n=1 Tax=Streptomyces sp. NPDC047014 TaxID=3155736 RepID=UPI0033CA9158